MPVLPFPDVPVFFVQDIAQQPEIVFFEDPRREIIFGQGSGGYRDPGICS
jgi:hypothetical protein